MTAVTPRNTAKGFGSYYPLSEPEMQQWFALDVLRVVTGFLESAGNTQRRDLSHEEIYSAGALLDAAKEVLECHGLPAEKETKAQFAQIKANVAAAKKLGRKAAPAPDMEDLGEPKGR